MPPTVPLSTPLPHWRDLPLVNPPNAAKLGQIQVFLDILMLSLVSLTPLETADLQQAAKELQLEQFQVKPEFSGPLFYPRQWWADPDLISIHEARSLVILVCHLARKYQELLRRAVTLMEQMQEQGKDPTRTALLGEYLANFQRLYSGYRLAEDQSAWQGLQPLAFKLLIDLLFYSATNGHHRLWLVSLEGT
jgi:hypothetical protein